MTRDLRSTRSPKIARRSRPWHHVLAVVFVVTVGAFITGCGGDGSEEPSDAFYEGLHDGLVGEGLDDEIATCLVAAVRGLSPSMADVEFFEANDDFPEEISSQLDDLTLDCVEA